MANDFYFLLFTEFNELLKRVYNGSLMLITVIYIAYIIILS